MKLHLPKALLTAVLALGLCSGSAAYGLTVNIGEYSGSLYTTSTADDATLPTGWTKDATTGEWHYTYDPTKNSVSLTFELNYEAINTGDQHVIYITSTGSTSWGINTNANGDALTGCWAPETRSNNGRYTDKDGQANTTVDTASTFTTLDTDSNGKVVLTFTTNNGGAGGGTYLYNKLNTTVYSGSGLSTTSAGSIQTLKINPGLVSGIGYNETYAATVSNDNGWKKEYEKAVFNTIVSYETGATILNNGVQKVGYESNSQAGPTGLANAGDIVIGGSGQLYLQTYGGNNNVKSGNDITVDNDIYLGSSSQATGGLRLATYSGAISLKNITLVEDAKISKEHDKGSDNKVTITGAVSGDYTLTVAADQSGNKFDDVIFSGTVDLKGLTLGSTAEITFNNVTNIGTLTMNEGTGLSLAGTGNVTLGGGTLTETVQNTNANLAMSGNWTADTLFAFDHNFDAETGYSDGANGYLQNGDVFTIVDSSDNGAVAWTGSLTVGGSTYEVTSQDGDAVVTVADDTTNYYINTTVDYTADSNVAKAGSIVMNGGTLNLNTALTTDATISAEAITNPGKVVVGDNVSLANTSVDGSGGDVVLAGSAKAVYEMGSATTANATLGTQWYGTTKLNGTALTGSVNLASFANGAHSTIEFKNTSGWITATTNAFNVSLAEGDAITFTDGGNNNQHVFTGSISGKGNIVRKDNKGSFQYYDLKGDISQWSGTFEHKNNDSYHESTITLSGAATNANANFTQSGNGGGKLSVVVDNTNAVTMNGTVSATAGTIKLQNKGTGKLTVAEVKAAGGNVQISGNGSNAIEIGTLSIAAGNTVANGTTATKGAGAPTSTNDAGVNITITSKLAIASDNAFALSGALTMGSNATVDLTGFTINEGQTIYTLGSAGSINFAAETDYLAGTGIEGYTAKVTIADTNPNASEATVADADAPQYLVLTLEKATVQELTEITVTGGSYADGVLTFTTEEDLSAGLAAEFNIKFDDATWQSILKENPNMAPEISVALNDVNWTDEGVTKLTINGEGPIDGQLQITNDGTAAGKYVTAYIPEPTTSTLSLLALAALAVRRRRR